MLEARRECTCSAGGPGWETCYGASPAVWGACVCNGVPVANAGTDRSVSYNTTVPLDGSLSMDADGDPLQFHWTLDSVPPGSTAMLDDATRRAPTFKADVPGDYGVSLTVSDAFVDSAPVHVTISAHNDAPLVRIVTVGNITTGTQVTLDASGTTDANSDPLAFAWTLTRPAGGTAVPANPTAATTMFTADVDGTYVASLSVDDGHTTSTGTLSVTSYHRVTPLAFQPVGVDYDKAHDRVLFTSSDPVNALYAYDTATDSFTTVALSQPPGGVTVAPNGSHAIVSDYLGISNVDLSTLQVTNRIPISPGFVSTVDPGNGFAYVFPTTMFTIRGIKLATGAVINGATARESYMLARWRPGTNQIYATGQVFTQVFSYGTAGGTAQVNIYNTIGTTLWIGDDGSRVFSNAPAVYAADLTQVGQLQAGTSGISTSSATSTLLSIPSSQGDGAVDVYGYPSITYQRSVALPPELKNGMVYPAHAKWVFLHADGVHFSVVAQVSSSEWAVTNL